MSTSQEPTVETPKFPVNQATISGIAIRVSDLPSKKKANVTVMVNDTGNYKNSKFINVLFSGKHYDKFIAEHKEAVKSLPIVKVDGKDKQINPGITVHGQGFFASRKTEAGAFQQSYSLIASGKFGLTKGQKELDQFRREANPSNTKINNLDIRLVLAGDPKEIKTKTGKSMFTVSAAHNYINANKEQKSMFAKLLVPPNVAASMKAGYKKGDHVLVSASIQPSSYKTKPNENGVVHTINTFSLITKNIQINPEYSVNKSKANVAIDQIKDQAKEAIDDVAKTTKKAERVEKAAESSKELETATSASKTSMGR